MSNITHRNPELSSALTETNIETGEVTVKNSKLNNITVRNATVEDFTNFSDGTILLGKYVVKDRLPITSGEANIYICEYNDEEYIAKIYKRKDAVKPEIIKKLKNLDSPYVAKIYDTGEHNGMPVTILPYYRLGSLQGKRFSLKQLKRMVIPCINEALQSLHNIGILHKDLKPANIMMLSDGKGIALIDFGISSVMNGGSSVLISNAGWTPEYSAPETSPPKCLYLEESDYYSFGITLYELFCGYNPYEHFSTEEKERMAVIQKLSYPEDIPQELRDLITGLTYNDITNREELDNPNRRWTYQEVKKWLAGEKQPIPGSNSVATNEFNGKIYKFARNSYTNVNDLIPAMAENWDEGKKHLSRKLLSGFFEKLDQDLASYCMDAEEEIEAGKNSDLTFFKFIYKTLPSQQKFYWKGHKYSSLRDLGEKILIKLRMSDMTEMNLWDEMLGNNVISNYLELHSQSEDMIEVMRSLENTSADRKNDFTKYYLLAYYLTGRRVLIIAGEKFSTIEELIEYMNNLLAQSVEDFEIFCSELIDSNNDLNVEFESWLIALNKREELKKWRENLKQGVRK